MTQNKQPLFVMTLNDDGSIEIKWNEVKNVEFKEIENAAMAVVYRQYNKLLEDVIKTNNLNEQQSEEERLNMIVYCIFETQLVMFAALTATFWAFDETVINQRLEETRKKYDEFILNQIETTNAASKKLEESFKQTEIKDE